MRILPYAACVWSFCACTIESEPNDVTGTPVVHDSRAQAISESSDSIDSTETAEALEALKEMSDFLAEQTHLSFEAEVNFDVVQPAGYKLEFGSTRKITLRRPDHVTLAVQHRDGIGQSLYFDGNSLLAVVPNRKAYARLELPGTVAAALDYLVTEFGVPSPLGELIDPELYAELAGEIESASWIGEELIGGVPCDHLMFRTRDVDFQLWLEQGEQVFPHRLVITYRSHEGDPQFRARLKDWNTAVETQDQLFSFVPPADFASVSFPELFDSSDQEAPGE